MQQQTKRLNGKSERMERTTDGCCLIRCCALDDNEIILGTKQPWPLCDTPFAGNSQQTRLSHVCSLLFSSSYLPFCSLPYYCYSATQTSRQFKHTNAFECRVASSHCYCCDTRWMIPCCILHFAAFKTGSQGIKSQTTKR